MRGLWRISKPLYAAGAASLQSSMARSSSQGARRFIGFTATRWEPAAASSATTAASDAAAAISDQAKGNAAGAVAEEADLSPPVDLKDVGAETTKVLTIADVLTRREEELSEQGSAAPYFDEWESIPGTHTIQDAIDMMVECNIGSLIVTEDNAGIVGIVTERDVMKKTSPRALAVDQEKPVKEIMSSHIMCIPPTTTVIDALATMTKENIRHLAVVNSEISTAVKKGSVPEEAMRCVLSIKDIVKAYAHFEAQKKTLLLEQGQSSTIAAAATEGTGVESTTTSAPSTEATVAGATPLEGTEGEAPQQQPPAPPPTPAVTAATLLKKKHKKIKLILNTRPEDNISVAEAVEEMAKHNFGAVLIVDKEQRVVGIFTERDYLTKVLYPKEDPTRMRVTDACTKKLSCFQIEDSLEKCWTQAANLDFRHFPVIGTMRKDREKELAGVLSIKDIVREISKDYETPSGFRLMEFFKSKMTKEQPPAATTTAAAPVSVPAATPAAPQAESSSPEATSAPTTADITTEPATPAASGSGESSENKEIQPETTSAQKTTGKTE